MSKTRVFVSQNGDYESTPTIVIVKDGMSFEDFMKKVAEKMKVEKKFARCFYITNGAEIDDPDDLMPEDKLFVSEGEDFKKKEDVGMLSGGLSAMAVGATSLYSSVSTYAKSKMSEDMKKKVESAETKVTETMAPVVEKAKEVTAPAIDWADKKLDVASEKIKEKTDEFMASDTYKKLKEKVIDPAATKSKELYKMAATELTKVGKEGKEKMAPLKEYMASVKVKMGKEWDEKYAPAVKQMYEQAKEQGKKTQQEMQKTWNEKIEPIIKAKKKDDEPVIAEPVADAD
eukprot:CAMPEP_0114519368 /NCGR_PEP_ID=MMETSP0109-20121206/18963_1 /TAXON_ID=29199 /ORGANISM="Chlorarachnion reptans, Strain CCCM449" /LENGTH=286 /DNA_ID=CAMNT_0001700097 /DNA_START=168 /DNA_END=1028 /DNA_ORIENTATION=-